MADDDTNYTWYIVIIGIIVLLLFFALLFYCFRRKVVINVSSAQKSRVFSPSKSSHVTENDEANEESQMILNSQSRQSIDSTTNYEEFPTDELSFMEGSTPSPSKHSHTTPIPIAREWPFASVPIESSLPNNPPQQWNDVTWQAHSAPATFFHAPTENEKQTNPIVHFQEQGGDPFVSSSDSTSFSTSSRSSPSYSISESQPNEPFPPEPFTFPSPTKTPFKMSGRFPELQMAERKTNYYQPHFTQRSDPLSISESIEVSGWKPKSVDGGTQYVHNQAHETSDILASIFATPSPPRSKTHYPSRVLHSTEASTGRLAEQGREVYPVYGFVPNRGERKIYDQMLADKGSITVWK